MNRSDVELWKLITRCKELIDDCKLSYSITDRGIYLFDGDNLSLGVFQSVEMLYGYLCGYSARNSF